MRYFGWGHGTGEVRTGIIRGFFREKVETHPSDKRPFYSAVKIPRTKEKAGNGLVR